MGGKWRRSRADDEGDSDEEEIHVEEAKMVPEASMLGVPSTYPLDGSIISWNCKGAKGKEFKEISSRS